MAYDENLAERVREQLATDRGMTMKGWILVAPEALGDEREFGAWVQRGVSFARSLPAKA